jgi:hypothetical protein
MNIDRSMEGHRVVLDFIDDPITNLHEGSEGTVNM